MSFFDPAHRTVTTGASGDLPSAAEQTLEAGTVVGNYVVDARLAAGGGGTVYRAHHGATNQAVAIKVLSDALVSSAAAVARFVREADIANKIRHPNIVEIFEFGHLTDGRPFLVMELLEGVTLRKMIEQRGRLTPHEVVELLEPVCSALEATHAVGVVHRDLTAANVHATTTATGPLVKLLDFGIAKLMYPEPGEPKLTALGMVLGTAHAMSPEQIRGDDVDPRSDIYSLGVLAYQLLTAAHPFVAATRQEVVRMTLEISPPRPSERAPVSPEIDEVVLRCLNKAPELRYATPREFITALKAAVSGAAAQAQTTAWAVALYVEALAGDGVDPDTDEVVDDIANVFDTVDARLSAAGYQMPLQTASSILGVRQLPTADAERALAKNTSQTLAEMLAAELAQRPGAVPGLHVNVVVHVDRASFRENGELIGGPILNVGAWAPKQRNSGVFIAPEGSPTSMR